MSEVHIQVSENDIRYGLRGDPCECPVARALRRTFKKSVFVGGDRFAYVKREDGTRLVNRYDVPRQVQVNIAEFDMVGEMQPFEFDLQFSGECPEPTQGAALVPTILFVPEEG